MKIPTTCLITVSGDPLFVKEPGNLVKASALALLVATKQKQINQLESMML
jgi:hypothetical protein